MGRCHKLHMYGQDIFTRFGLIKQLVHGPLSDPAGTLGGMSTTPPPPGPRPAEVVQAEIRALMQETGGWLWGPTRARYEQLRDEWVAAMRGEVAAAA